MKISEINIDRYETLLLDRDGTINVHLIGDYVRKWEDFEFIPDALSAIEKWSKEGKRIIIVTNQRGIGKGLFSDQDLNTIHSKMIAEIEAYGGKIDKLYYCSSLDDNDMRRKPGRGMFDEILHDFPEINVDTTVMIGDSDSDLGFAINCGIDFIRVDSLKRDKNKKIWILS